MPIENNPLAIAVKALRQLPPEVREKVVSILEKAPPSISIEDLVATVLSQKLGSVAPEKLNQLFAGFANLIPVVAANPRLAEGVAEYVTSLAFPETEKDISEEFGALRIQVSRLLKCEASLAITGKAQSVLWGHGNVFEGGHIITQIRPLFMTDLQHRPEHGLIVHELRLEFKNGAQSGSFCVALDTRQLTALKSVLERAVDKELSLRKGPGNFQYLMPRSVE